MPNNPYLRRAALVANPNFNKGSRNGRVVSALIVTNKLTATPELGNPAGGPTTTRSGGIGGGGGSNGGGNFPLA